MSSMHMGVTNPNLSVARSLMGINKSWPALAKFMCKTSRFYVLQAKILQALHLLNYNYATGTIETKIEIKDNQNLENTKK